MPVIDPEPSFVLKAKDDLCVHAVISYYNLCRQRGLDVHAHQVGLALGEIKAWRDRNRDACKDPQHTHISASGLVAREALEKAEELGKLRQVLTDTEDLIARIRELTS
jgi:hypothetical protein